MQVCGFWQLLRPAGRVGGSAGAQQRAPAWQRVCGSHRLCPTKANPTLARSAPMGRLIQTYKSHGRGAILEGQGPTPSAHACRIGHHSQLDGDHDYSWVTASHHQSDLIFGLSAIHLGGGRGPTLSQNSKSADWLAPLHQHACAVTDHLDQTPGSEYLHNHASDGTALSSYGSMVLRSKT